MELQRGGAAPLPAHGKALRRGSLPGTANFFAFAIPLFDCRQRPSSTQPSGPASPLAALSVLTRTRNGRPGA